MAETLVLQIPEALYQRLAIAKQFFLPQQFLVNLVVPLDC